MSTGAELITAERERQITEEGYTPEHDQGHAQDLTKAGAAYAEYVVRTFEGEGLTTFEDLDQPWPWHPGFWKPTGNPVRDLTKAGALIAAAIDCLNADPSSPNSGEGE